VVAIKPYGKQHRYSGGITPAELTRVGIALSRSFRTGGLLQQITAERMAAPVLGSCGLCLFRNGEAAFHYSVNEGFTTFRRFSLKEDLCAAGMVNKSAGSAFQAMAEIQNALFDRLQKANMERSI